MDPTSALWAAATLATVTITAILAARFGVEIAVGVFASLTVLANLLAAKTIAFGPFIAPAAVLVYASTFLLTDILSELFGKEKARLAVWTGFLANMVMLLSVLIAVRWSASPVMDPALASSFDAVFGFAPRVIAASMIAYLASQHHDVWAYGFWKDRTGGRRLWLRNNASTMASQAIDTLIFITLAFYGLVPNSVLLQMMAGQYVIKILIAALDTPFIYLALAAARRAG
ncbi:queuosine precursor transporter [Methanotrichaceae archaeon M04Ac]|uniref:Probable queuosine precursor transporter n=1 Tax=Candidatus Methanocrinis alkalitolerans TaxID=3033395 RepID=A0ABT5XDH9_9EURY|nr:queuosine precursor transporter [Candidatus Methanocrinis alkalitolerans]MCR3884707.1 queuosine precursor transporter [Methanothrix sp.]MDF0592770.1 queuosine precursor transporter [Candidatus Methanocrinis alkalitolerans]